MAFTAEGGVEPKGERYDRSYLVKSNDKLYKRTEYNDFIYSSNNLDVGSIGLNKYGTAVISDVYEIFSVLPDNLPTFVSELIQRPHNMAEILKYRQGCLYGQYRIYAEDFLSVSVFAPKKCEQEKISHFLDVLDNKIAYQRSLVEALKKYKRGVMQRIFRNMPIVSPSGFETVHLSDIFKKVSRRNSNGDIKNVITNSAEYGLIPQRDFFDKDIAVDGNTANYYVIEHGDFVYNPRKSNSAPYGPFNRYEREEKGIISPLYTCLVLQTDIEPSYLAWYFKSDAWYRYIYDNGSQGVRHDRVSMTDDLLMGIPVIIPAKEAQLKIAKLLDCLESRFQTELSQYESLKSIRVALLQQLFI